MQWLNDHAQAISAVASVCTLFVWLFYAQLLYNGYVRQRRPRIIVNRGKGVGTDALCLISNMSSEAIYIQHLVAVLHTPEGAYPLDIVEYQQQSGEENEACYCTHQGPLPSGDYLHIQTFGSIVQQLARYWKLDDALLQEQTLMLEIRVIAIYGSEDMPVGAARRFHLSPQAEPTRQLVPVHLDTQRMNSRRDRQRVVEWAKEIELHKAQ